MRIAMKKARDVVLASRPTATPTQTHLQVRPSAHPHVRAVRGAARRDGVPSVPGAGARAINATVRWRRRRARSTDRAWRARSARRRPAARASGASSPRPARALEARTPRSPRRSVPTARRCATGAPSAPIRVPSPRFDARFRDALSGGASTPLMAFGKPPPVLAPMLDVTEMTKADAQPPLGIAMKRWHIGCRWIGARATVHSALQ